MFNFKKLKTATCYLFIFLILIVPIGNIFAADTALSDSLSVLLLTSPATLPLSVALQLSNLLGFNPANSLLGFPADVITGAIVSAFSMVSSVIANTIIDLGQGILTTVVDSSSTWLSPTDFNQESKTYNEVVATGWGIVRNIANAALVIGLVIIAINIILGREENKAKKTLINFIIIALLINFTPVICGFIIDGSNILTKSFVTGGINSTPINEIVNSFAKKIGESKNNNIECLMVSITYLLFSFVSFFIYILYALLFLGRSVILWILVIVSPIAFATKVFPQSKYIKKVFPNITYWDDWWESFIQWCVIGIPAGMSIYLANMLFAKMTLNLDNSTADALLGSLINSSIQCLTPFIILIAGFFISISAGGQVGSFVGGIATGAWAMSGGKIAGRLTEKAKEGGEWMIEGGKRTAAGLVVGGLSGAQQGLTDAQGKGVFAELKGLTAGVMKGTIGGAGVEGREFAAKKIAEVKEGVGWTKRGEYAGKLAGDIEESQKRLSHVSNKDLESLSTSGGLTKGAQSDAWAAMKESTKRGELTNTQLDYLVKNKGTAETFGIDLKDIAKARPDRANDLIGKDSFEIINGMSPEKAGKEIHSPALLNPDVLRSIARSNTKILDGKINKAKGKDIENIKKGYVKALEEAGVYTAGINIDDLKDFTVTNKTEIQKVINTLRGGNAKDKIMAEGLKELANYVGKGKLNKKS